MSNNNKLLVVLFSQHTSKVLQTSSMTTCYISSTHTSKLTLVVTDDTEIVHHTFNGMHSQRIAFIHVSPQSCANECYIINDFGVIFQQVDVGKLGALFSHMIDAFVKASIVEFVIAHNINNMWKLKTATLEKITEASHSLLLATKVFKGTMTVRIEVKRRMVVKVCGNHNVTTKNKNIALVVVSDVNVTEL
jgi:hypothetical protein